MKAYKLIIVTFFMAVLIVGMTGCEYEVEEPLWDKDFAETPTPVITQIEPAQAATPGVNYVTIRGENFAGVPDTNGVYFGATPAEIVQKSATAITVRRPNLATDSCTVKVVSDSALVVAKFGPYRIDPVLEQYGSFLENLILSVVAVDSAENLYVVETDSKKIHKVAPNGDKTIIGKASRSPYDARIGPDGNLYLVEKNRAIDKVDLTTGEVTRWTRLPSGKVVKFGDFGSNGYFYTGGTKTDLVIVTPDFSVTYAGFYATDEILAIRVYSGYVYVASRTSGSQYPAKIWRHTIDSTGNVGDQKPVIDMSTTVELSSLLIRAITFSSNGIMYIATDSPDPILVVDPATKKVDFFYKGILPSYCKQFYWGSGNYLYMICGDTNLGEEWTVYRVDTGTTGAL